MSQDWRISLASRNKLFYNDIPYVPIPMENIYTYVAFKDHEKNGIKTIQTMGQLVPKTETRAILVSLTPGNNTVFPISFKILNINDIYIKDSNQAYCPIWKKHIIFKIYGTLKIEESKNILEVSHLVPIQDIDGTWDVMTTLSIIACSEYRHYYRTKGQNDMLRLQWDKMKKN